MSKELKDYIKCPNCKKNNEIIEANKKRITELQMQMYQAHQNIIECIDRNHE